MTKYTLSSTVLLIYFGLLTDITAETYNLYGEWGEAYSLKMHLGHPHQVLHFLMDTGSTTMAVATQPDQDRYNYFRTNSSDSILETDKVVHTQYSEGEWWGNVASDFISIPSLPDIPEVRTDLALVTKSDDFFPTGQGWQGLLGLAYPQISARGEDEVPDSWLESLDRTMGRTMSFKMKLCGKQNISNSTHYGKFTMLDDNTKNENNNRIFKTPILRKLWYEIGVISVRVIEDTNVTEIKDNVIDVEMCRTLNMEKSIVDSGATNIRIPEAYLRQVVDRLKDRVNFANDSVQDQFWYHNRAVCWPTEQDWSLPNIAIDLLSAEAENQYFTLEITSQNYMRVVKVNISLVPNYCYIFGLVGTSETVLGYTAMEGFEVLFNRSGDWIGFQTSNCGPNTRITGPYNATINLTTVCELYETTYEVAPSTQAAQWTLLAISLVAAAVLVYVLAPCVKTLVLKHLHTSQQMSLSQASLVSIRETTY